MNYPASENQSQAMYLSGGGYDDTVGRRYRRAEIERGEAETMQEKLLCSQQLGVHVLCFQEQIPP